MDPTSACERGKYGGAATGMMGDGIGMYHVGAQPGRRSERDHRAGLLPSKHEVLIPQRRRSANAIHRHHDDGEVETPAQFDW